MYEETEELGEGVIKKHYRPSRYFTDAKWALNKYHFVAPVVPPAWVVKKLHEGAVRVEWNNTQQVGNCPCCDWPTHYLSELIEGNPTTYLLPGSAQPVDGWLQTIRTR